MQIGVPKEILADETRVAASPKSVEQLIKLGFTVSVESKAGKLSSFDDVAYKISGAKIVTVEEVWNSDIILKVNPPIVDEKTQVDEAKLLKEGANLISFIWPTQNPELIACLSRKNINVMAMDEVPRISRAQGLDALSSMSNIAGYRAVLEAASEFGRFFGGQMTAAGKIPPAKVFVIGAGVAGLSAICSATNLGAIVRAFDVRPEVKEQVKSLGADFLEIDFQENTTTEDGYAKETSEEFNKKAKELYSTQSKEADVIITTALIPGKIAPKLISKSMVDNMRSGSVIVDLAAANGGNCAYTVSNKIIKTPNGVKVIGYTNMVGRLPTQASQLYATNIANLLKLLCKEQNGTIEIDFKDVVLRSMTVIKDGKVTWPAPTVQVSQQSQKVSTSTSTKQKKVIRSSFPLKKLALLTIAITATLTIGSIAPASFLGRITIFMLACIVGYYVVWDVTHALHTPLMSVTNAISGIIVLGALLQIGQGNSITTLLSFIAILIASINIFGGFTVTKRMLEMFRKN
ncbi:NAD(P) transhydrogenase subunit alpha [Candidatus Photodesmus blepharus]|uniref:NAD(P) transhydrogenase subunit alpha n=1 Tax=Candidatus Photodesmus blepharonis TaxID=1179155 RepID=A0A084CNA0_9GAMM|nr:Re/Si-specific NAD(P)(+) transhydrogenase subunit alpha [Candidatus Photodesmus blepharus]KEY91279.1 NAD(P) transhydrogenase subunit alpha [Candidatus Photodesmus blepharus]